MWVLSDQGEKFLLTVSLSIPCGCCCFITHPRSTALEAYWHTGPAGTGSPARPFLPRWVTCPSLPPAPP